MSRIFAVLAGTAFLTLSWSVAPTALISIDPDTTAEIVFNDNRDSTDTFSGGILELDLEIQDGDWHLLGEGEPAGRVLAFAEAGKSPSIPGPLIRVPLDTEIHVTVTNFHDTTVVIHGFDSRRDGELQPLGVPAGSTQNVRFSADVPGTYFYWGSVTDRPLSDRAFEDSQLSGAFVVDAPGAATDDEIMLMDMWNDGRLPDGEPDLDEPSEHGELPPVG